ncbi:MAG: PocR ligand-binding domain-containing protein [Firmicutes bacterium]|nr:PocR ligand-binding domain-containing protein [Bacillota bacterium]
MISMFDLDQLQGLLRDFYEISHIRITVFDEDLKELVSYPEEVAPYCAVIRGTLSGFEACMRCDREACAKAAKKKTTHVYRCHAGLTEAVTPLYVGEVLAGYLLFGHVFSYPDHEKGWTAVDQKTASLPLNRRMLKDAIFEAPIIGESYTRSAAKILHAVASYLIMERMATLREDMLAVRLDSYLSAHYTQKLSSSAVAEYLGIGRTQLYELSRQMYGCGVAEHIRDLRVGRAKELLKGHRDLSIAEVAERCGFSDYNYFITVFSRETGCSPGAFRKETVALKRRL